jgi:hypothetical protein
MSERYQIISPDGSDAAAPLPESNVLAGLLVKDRQLVPPLLELVEQARNSSSRLSVRSTTSWM